MYASRILPISDEILGNSNKLLINGGIYDFNFLQIASDERVMYLISYVSI